MKQPCNVCFSQEEGTKFVFCPDCNETYCIECYGKWLDHQPVVILFAKCLSCKKFVHMKDEVTAIVEDMILKQIETKTEKQRMEMKEVQVLELKNAALQKEMSLIKDQIKYKIEEIDTSLDKGEVDAETKKYIEKDTRSCPNCHIRISLSVGCSRMFCTHCHIYFDYLSGYQTRPAENVEASDFRKAIQLKYDLFPTCYRKDLKYGTVISKASATMKRLHHIYSKNKNLPFEIQNQRARINRLHVSYHKDDLERKSYLTSLQAEMALLYNKVETHQIYTKYINRIESLQPLWPSISLYANIAEDVVAATRDMHEELLKEDFTTKEDLTPKEETIWMDSF